LRHGHANRRPHRIAPHKQELFVALLDGRCPSIGLVQGRYANGSIFPELNPARVISRRLLFVQVCQVV
jgi:hypothetical protein